MWGGWARQSLGPGPNPGCSFPGRCSGRASEGDWERSEKNLWVWLAERRWQRAELAGRLRAALEALSEQAQVLQKWERELGLSRIQCELLAPKQKVRLWSSPRGLPCLSTAPGRSPELASSPY